MNEEELKRLLEKYYEGISTDEDENALRTFFSGDMVPEGFETEKQIFGYYIESVDIPEPSPDFESRIIAGVYSSDGKSRFKIRKFLVPLLSAAAGLLLLAGSYFFFIRRDIPQDTFTDPEIAYAETMKILFDVSSQMNHGARSLHPVSKINEVRVKSFSSMNKSAILVEKNLKSLEYLRTEN